MTMWTTHVPIRLPGITEIIRHPFGDDSGDGDDNSEEDGQRGGEDDDSGRDYPVYESERELDGELYVYSSDDVRQLSVEAYNQLVQRRDLDAEQAREIADLFHTLHTLDVDAVEVGGETP